MAANPRSPRSNLSGAAGQGLVAGIRVAGGAYILKRLLGRGGLGEVWLAWDRKLERDIALKILPQTLLQEASLIETLKAEATRTQQLVHPGIARVLDFVHDYETVAIAMEHVDGWSLAALKVDRPKKRYRVEEIIPWIQQACRALEYAHHEICLVHRELKPSNFLLDNRDQVKLTDFGIAHAIRTALAQRGHLVYGSIAHMSPQQLKGDEASVLDDVYSIAATIYDLLTGTPPFYTGDILLQVRELPPPSMTERLAELKIEDSIPPAWEETVAACLAKNPAQRPHSASEILRLLESSKEPKAPVPASAIPAGAPLPESKPDIHPQPESKPAEVAPVEKSGAETQPDPAGIHVEHLDIPQQGEHAQISTSPEPVAETAARRPWLPGNLRPFVLPAAAILAIVVVVALAWSFLRSHPKSAPEARMTGPPGSLDTSFRSGSGADNEIRSLAIQPDGKILLGGRFTNIAGISLKGIARLQPDGTPQTNFPAATTGSIHALVVQPDNKIFVAGDFTRLNGETRRRIARLNTDGSLDSNFDPKGALNREARAVVIQDDGKILVGGSFDSSSGNRHNRITRFNPDGSRDGTFAPGAGANGIVSALGRQADGKIIAGGDFTRFDNAPLGRVVRLNRDGSVDPSFKLTLGANAAVLALFVQADGKILIGGNFTTVEGTPRERLARLQADGSLDNSFKPDPIPKGSVRSIVVEPKGELLAGGSFTSVGAWVRNGIARFHPDGTLDRDFDPGYGVTDGSVWNVGLQPGGKIVIVGAFRQFNGSACGRIACLNGGSAKR